MYRSFLFSLFCVVASHYGFGQPEALIDKHYAEFTTSPGAAVAIYRDGQIILSKGYGIANMDHDIPITPKTIFDIGSVSKQFTAACIFLLEQQGKLSIDDPVQRWVPEIPVYDNDVIRIKNLIHHTSGLRDYAELMDYAGIPMNNVFTEEMGLDIMARQSEPNFKPGAQFMYDNGGYLLLAIIVRRASGMSIGEYAQSQIFKPLGMNNTFILENPNRIIKNKATGYTRLKDGGIEELDHKNFAIGGDGQVYSTVEDLFLWDRNFYDPKVGGTELLRRMHERGVLNNGDTLSYAGGLFMETYKGQRVIQHTGAWGGFRSAFFRLPNLQTSLVILSNYTPTASLGVVYSILDALIPEPPVIASRTTKTNVFKVNKKKLATYTGLFEMTGEPQKRFRITVKNDSLNMEQFWTRQAFTLIPVAEGRFVHPQLSFMQFDFNQPDLSPVIQERIGEIHTRRIAPYTPIADLHEYEGNYRSEEVGATYTVEAKGSQLIVKRGKEGIHTLDQVGPDVFGQGHIGFLFTRADGNVNAFLLQDRRIRNLKFKKVK